MEQNETEEQAAAYQQPSIVLSDEALSYLRQTGKWASFLSVMGFIFCGLILLVALFIGAVAGFMSRFSPAYSAIPQAGFSFISILYIAMDVLYFFFPFYLYRFSDRIKKGILHNDSATLTDALGQLKSFFKLWGIVTIVVVGIYALIFIVVILIGVGGAMSR